MESSIRLQQAHRISSSTKRARVDGSRREDDWTCPNCGNVNFSFRTTCNMHNCTQPRPTDHNLKPAMKPMQIHQSYPSAYGSGAPSVYLGMPPYGSTLFNGPPMPQAPYPYNYNNRLPVGPLHLSVASPYTGGPMMGTGGVYPMPPLLDNRYGLPLPMGFASMGRPGTFPNGNLHKTAEDVKPDSDWICPKCGNVNFPLRTVCNMRKCNTPRPGSQGSKSVATKDSKPKMPEGSWKCEKCNNINYPFRTKCNRQNCGAEKPSETANEQQSDGSQQ